MAVQNYSKPSTYTTPDGKRTAELDYQRETLTVFEGPRTLATIPMDFKTLDEISMYELRQIVEGTEETPAEAPHVCDDSERTAYRQYISDGIGDTDGYFAPESFEAWLAHHHRAIGHQEPRTQKCTPTECHAPAGEKVKMVQHLGLKPRPGGGQRRGVIRNESLCTPCYTARRAA